MAIVVWDGEQWTVQWDPSFEPDTAQAYYVVKQVFLQWVKDLMLAVQELRK